MVLQNKNKIVLIEKLGRRGEKLLQNNISEKEEIIIKLKGAFGEALVVTDKRFYILKWGYMAGNLFGGRCVTFDFNSITGVEFKKSLLTGHYEILTPATQNTQKSFWTTRASTTSSDNIISFHSDKFKIFEEAARRSRELLLNAKSHSKTANSEIGQLEKLGELKEKGLITEKEFQAKKKQLLGL